MATRSRLDVPAVFASWSGFHMQLEMLGSCHELQIARRVVQGVSIDVVNILRRFELAAKEFLHHDPVFRNVMAFTDHHVSVSILDVGSYENTLPFGHSMPFIQRVMALAQPFRERFVHAFIYGTLGVLPVRLLEDQRIAVSVPTLVMNPAHSSACAAFGAVLNRAKRHLFRHTTA